MKGKLYNYKGQMLTQADIAKLEGINRSTLADWYKKTNDMQLAVDGAKKSLAQRNIEYNGEFLSLKAISDKESIKFESLKRFYDATNDIYLAVEKAKESKLKRNGSIEYNGKMMSILAIAKEQNLDNHALGRYFEQTGNIYEAIKMAKESKLKQNGTIEYKGLFMTISAIANLENIKRETLKEYFELYNDIYKAVFITKESQLKRKQALFKGKQATYKQLSMQYGVSVLEIERMVKNGISLDELEKKPKKVVKSSSILEYDDSSLYRYCLDNSYNYWVIYYLITEYGKTPEEAINMYIANGQQIPVKWIYEKYGLLLKHLLLRFNLDSNRIIKIMRDNECNIKDAIAKLVFISNNANSNFKKAEIDWMEDLYSFIKDMETDEYLKIKAEFFVTDKEEQFLKEKSDLINLINRQLLLFEFAEIIETWPVEEIFEMMDLFEITEDEKIEIVLNLYTPFDNQVINPTLGYKEKEEQINEIVLNNSVSEDDILNDSNLSETSKKEIICKRNLLKKILQPNKEIRHPN